MSAKNESPMITADVAVFNVVSYINYSLFMEKFGIVMSTASKVKSVNLLLHICGIFENDKNLDYMLSDMESVYIRRLDDIEAKFPASTIDSICKHICTLYDNGLGARVISIGERHTHLYLCVLKFLEPLF